MASFTVSLQGAIPPSAARPSAKALAARACNYFISNIADALKIFEESLLFCCVLFDMDGIELGDQAASIHPCIAAEGIRGLLPKQRFLSVKEHCDS